ncbi:TorF family putative porin [Stakelama tenebrarum]|uniref:Porin n=1 Tax=Stakelama tenebrarum TaxID=2711215 RepID=A0A6G6Y0H8_9SPHN|nr:TorF family putative porin [Sphingosinithalassobacter tenebrarum]QIG78409.1 hypothetical protein G5C33_00425 [Sphingosinithalassobacter tenebrarum]
MRTSHILVSAAMLLGATPAFAQDTAPPSPISISGGADVVSDYRFRGFSQTNEEATIQGWFQVDAEGFYIGTWGSGIGFGNGTEIDVYGGYSTSFGAIGVDIGATAYMYPGVSDSTILEPYLGLSTDIGPASLGVGVAWAPGGQDSLGDDSGVYLSGDLGIGVPTTPITLSAHIGYAKSDSFLGGFDGEVIDYSFGASVSYDALTFGISYVNTDEPTTGGYKDAIGADGAVIFTLGAAF